MQQASTPLSLSSSPPPHSPTTKMEAVGQQQLMNNGEDVVNNGGDVENSQCRSDDISVELTLGVSPSRRASCPPSSPPSMPPPQQQQQQQLIPPRPPPCPPLLNVPLRYMAAPAIVAAPAAVTSPRSGGGRGRRNHTQTPNSGKSETIPPAFPWAADRRATVHSLGYLLSHGIAEVHGEAQCKRCEARRVIRYDLLAKFRDVARLIVNTKHLMHDRAPTEWMNPAFPDCEACGQPNCMRPVVDGKKRNINWLFMLLGQTLGCCTLEQLKYFCKHTKNHRTGAKDRVLYLTYLSLCKQLDPTGPFDH